jgi:TonB family protein
MSFVCRWRYAFVGIAFLSCPFGTSWAQSTAKADQAPEDAVITKLSPLTYPPLARQTRITGDVELKLEVRHDGSVASVVAASGHPLLRQTALENAQQSQFACNDCHEELSSYRLVYSFELGPTIYCADTDDKSSAKAEQPYPRLTQSRGHVTLVDQPIGTCDLAGTITYSKVRSVKCLYLWKCAKPRLVSIY